MSIDNASNITIGPADGTISSWGTVQIKVSLKTKHGVRFVTADPPSEAGKHITLFNEHSKDIKNIVIYYLSDSGEFKQTKVATVVAGTSFSTSVDAATGTFLVMW